MLQGKYPDLERFSRATGIPADRLVEAFHIERDFHQRILAEPDVEHRKVLYGEVYTRVHALYGKNKKPPMGARNPRDRVALLFRKELNNRDILEVGCGEGQFLESVSRLIPHKRLVGLDVSINPYAKGIPGIELVSSDIVRFDLGTKFDVVFSDQVLEHIAPADLDMHLGSIRNALSPGGTLVVNLPNRLFGPSDVTRIIDFSYTGRVSAQGTHLNESTYADMIPCLEAAGFDSFRTILPVPRLKYWFPGLRVRPDVLRRVERSPQFMRMLHAIRLRGSCVARFGVCLICTRK